ncbi:FHA domain-containing protein [Nodularia harveyana UHCC-0300]|uniref:FHA domain-containing protein n=1 Tax=Nodularia harveyana UHCC-0300 TaxID=2974287 RepID=A0ABU5UHE6_9CYAN|nr:FHA domain-containing protein [Nodularia harveyana]MEA5582983.1 FHA domain-containing protein [Nodularia harveyana UHCC-0300]
MNGLTLQWHDAGQDRVQQIYEQQPSKNPDTVRIGRDPLRCDIVLTHPTVSGLHVEIFFHTQQQCFYIRNLRSPNPPVINGQQLVHGEMALNEGSIIYLGQAQLQVTQVAINNIAATIIIPPQSPEQPSHHYHPTTPPEGVYGLECPKCSKISPLENLEIGCPWCGTSLAASVSVLVAPNN